MLRWARPPPLGYSDGETDKTCAVVDDAVPEEELVEDACAGVRVRDAVHQLFAQRKLNVGLANKS